MKFCTQCGTRAATDSQKFCRVCGNKFPEMEYKSSQPALAGSVEEGNAALPQDLPPKSEEAAEHNEASPVQEDAAERIGTDAGGTAQEERSDALPDMPLIKLETDDPAYSDASSDNNAAGGNAAPGNNTYPDTDKYFAWDTQQSEPSAKKPQKHTKEQRPPRPGRKGHSFLRIIIIALVLVLLGSGGYFGWQYYKQSTNATIGGVMYSIKDTTSVSISSPTAEDWEQLAKLTKLETVVINGDPSSDIVTEEQFRNLSALKQLAKLSVDGISIDGMLTDSLDSEALTSITFTNCGLTSEQCASMPELSSLETLDLHDNALTTLSFLTQCPNIIELDVSGNPITDCSGLTHADMLEDLSIDLCDAVTLSQLSSLEKLRLNGKVISNVESYANDIKNLSTSYEAIIALLDAQNFDAISLEMQSIDYGSLDYEDFEDIEYVNGYIFYSGEGSEVKGALSPDVKILKFDSNGIYYGQMSGGERSGEGTQYFSNNDNMSYYIGTWSSDMPNGAGTYYTHTWVDDGVLKLAFAGEYVNGYENGTITFTVEYDDIGSDDPSEWADHSGSQYATAQTTTFNSTDGNRETLKQISDSQYAYAQFGNDYWYNSSPSGHGVIMNGIEYQNEEVVEIAPEKKSTPKKNASSDTAASAPAQTSPSTTDSSTTPGIQDLIDFGMGFFDWLYN